MRVFTCTPKEFEGDSFFFSRDSGLMSRALAQVGVESSAIMPGPRRDDDLPGLLRTAYRNLESESWWRSLELDGLVFYSWAAPAYNRIIQAIQSAGIPVLVNMDTSGLISRSANPEAWKHEGHPASFIFRGGLKNLPRSTALYLRDNFTHKMEARRMPHYMAATKIAAVTPQARLWIANEAKSVGYAEIDEKLVYLPHPQSPDYCYAGTPKENLVVTVGRWKPEDWWQKQPQILLRAYHRFLSERPDWKVMVIGRDAPNLPNRLGVELGELAKRIEFVDFIPPADLPLIYNRAKIGFWSSRSEGQQGAAAQALCCGCSVVSNSLARMNCFRHYVSRESGRLAEGNTPGSLSEALVLEAEAWENQQRDPFRISKTWLPEFDMNNIARRALHVLELKPFVRSEA